MIQLSKIWSRWWFDVPLVIPFKNLNVLSCFSAFIDLPLSNLCSSAQWRKREWKYFPYNFLTVSFLTWWPICFLNKIPCKNVLAYRAKTLSAVLLLSFEYINSWIAHDVSKIIYVWPGTLSFIELVTSSKLVRQTFYFSALIR